MHLPDIYFAFDWRPGERPLYFHRDPDGTIRRVDAPDVSPPEASLLIHGPGTPIWDVAGLNLLVRVRDHGGAVLPLGAVLSRCGFPSRIRRDQLLERLGGTRVELDDPRMEGREILNRLAEILEGLDPAEEAPSDPPPGPRALVVADIMSAPDAPGVYTFVSSEGQAIYIGKARSLRRRLASHIRTRSGEPAKRAALIAGATEVRWEETGSELEALLREHVALRRQGPSINVQRAAHRRPRGAWRDRAVVLLLPSAEENHQEVLLVAGDGRFHFEHVPRGGKLPRGFWKRVRGFLEGTGKGWGPGDAKREIDPATAAELSEITLSWLVLHGTEVTQIDLTREVFSPELKARILRGLALDPREERVEIR
jgi:hypothetical protein